MFWGKNGGGAQIDAFVLLTMGRAQSLSLSLLHSKEGHSVGHLDGSVG